MSFDVGKISGVINEIQAKAVKKINGNSVNETAEVIGKTAFKAQNVVSDSIVSKTSISPSEALKAQALFDYQYPPNADFLGCDKEAQAINEALKHCDLERIKDMIKTGDIFYHCSKHEAPVAQACKQFGVDKVLAEVNAALEQSHIINNSGLTHKSAVHSSLLFDDSLSAKLARINYELTKKESDMPIH